MQLIVFASGSSGNCLLLSSGDSHILIDAGISMRRISAGLTRAGISWHDIGGVLITHEHSDHISGLKTLIRQRSLPIYAPRTVSNRLRGMLPGIDACLHIIPVGEAFGVSGFRVSAFHTPHDTDESVGYRVERGGVFALATDMGHVSEEVVRGLSGADTVLIEANHDPDMLRFGNYPAYLKMRILSARGHLSNPDCGELARMLCESGTRRIVLGHLSRENNRPELALQTVRAALSAYSPELYCAPADGFLSLPVGKDVLCLRSD